MLELLSSLVPTPMRMNQLLTSTRTTWCGSVRMISGSLLSKHYKLNMSWQTLFGGKIKSKSKQTFVYNCHVCMEHFIFNFATIVYYDTDGIQ